RTPQIFRLTVILLQKLRSSLSQWLFTHPRMENDEWLLHSRLKPAEESVPIRMEYKERSFDWSACRLPRRSACSGDSVSHIHAPGSGILRSCRPHVYCSNRSAAVQVHLTVVFERRSIPPWRSPKPKK